MQMHLCIMASNEKREITKYNLVHQNLGQTLASTLMDGPPGRYRGTADFPACVKVSPLIKTTGKRTRSLKLHLGDFRPLHAPFVPKLLRILIGAIEEHCRDSGWDVMYDPLKKLQNEAPPYAMKLIRYRDDEAAMRHLVAELNHEMLVATMRAFLSMFNTKPMHMTKAQLKRFTKRPLYDHFLRPNPEIKTLIRELVIPKTRTGIDTLAYIMVHIMHAWEMPPNQHSARSALADVYGPLLISFTERPIIIDRDVNPDKTEEAALLEVIMDVCDIHFWNHLGMLKIEDIFKDLRPPIDVGHTSISVLNTTVTPMPHFECLKSVLRAPMSTNSLTRIRMRPIQEILQDIQEVRLPKFARKNANGSKRVRPDWRKDATVV